MTKLSQNFTLEEMTRSMTATRKGWKNIPDDGAKRALEALAENTLQPIRNALGAMHSLSGFRSERLNTYIGGAKTSQHKFGEADDFIINGMTTLEICRWITENGIPFDQLIDEGRWVHISYSRNHNRREVLTAVFSEDKPTEYRKGLMGEYEQRSA